MKKEIKLALVYRDMWQSAGKYVPRVDQLVRVAPPIIDMGCWSRVETNGGGFEQVNLLFGENPNKAVRDWTQPFNDVGIQTQMLERGLNGIRMSPVPKDVRKLMFKVKKLQGTDISRSFDGLNNPQNLALSFEYAREGGMVAQGALSITHSPIHTVDHYVKLADDYISLGAEEICIKDMAGVGRPVSIGKIIKGIRERHPKIIIQYHGHSTPGFSIVSSLEAARNGADIIDVGMEPLSWGTGHADLLTVHEMLVDAGFSVPDINMKAYMEVRQLTQEFMHDFLGFYIDASNRQMSSLLIGPGLPGGMMGSLMADLQQNLRSLNKWLHKRDMPIMTQDELLLSLFDEVKLIWPKLGYPPLVTPFSQYVKNIALMNVLQMIKGKERWSMIDENTWGMILGESGQLPGKLAPELIALAEKEGREFYTGNPQDLYPDELDMYREKMKIEGWDTGQDDEELMQYAMHPQQYVNLKSGKAKEEFLADLEMHKSNAEPSVKTESPAPTNPKNLELDINGEKFKVTISYPGQGEPTEEKGEHFGDDSDSNNGYIKQFITAPLEGKFYLTKDSTETPIKVGDTIAVGDIIAYIESMKVINAVSSDKSGKVLEILARDGEDIDEDDYIIQIG